MKNACLRCGYRWTARSSKPLRCPRCKSTRWDRDVIRDRCMRCNAEWVQRGDERPKYCPVCHSGMWNAEKRSFTCPKCGKTRILRSNSREDLCPSCDMYQERRKAGKNGFLNTPSGMGKVLHLWKDGEGLVLTFIHDGKGIAYLYDTGRYLGEIDLDSWFRSHGQRLDPYRPQGDERYDEVMKKAVEKILSRVDISEKTVDNISALRGVDKLEATIISMMQDGVPPLSISMKLEIPFSKVMDTLSSIPPMSGTNGQKNNRPRPENKQWVTGSVHRISEIEE